MRALSLGCGGDGDAGRGGRRSRVMRALDFPTHPLSHHIYLVGIRSWLLLHFASADPQIPISHPALSKIPRSDVWPMDASKDHAQVRSSPLPTSQTAPLVSPRCTPTSASLRLRLTKNRSLSSPSLRHLRHPYPDVHPTLTTNVPSNLRHLHSLHPPHRLRPCPSKPFCSQSDFFPIHSHP